MEDVRERLGDIDRASTENRTEGGEEIEPDPTKLTRVGEDERA